MSWHRGAGAARRPRPRRCLEASGGTHRCGQFAQPGFMLVQSEQFGTSIAKTLRIHGDTLRTQRVQQWRSMAAKTTVKLVFPLVFFIFPALFLVVLGSSGDLMMMDSFKTFLDH
jgi:hypothetical protein